MTRKESEPSVDRRTIVKSVGGAVGVGGLGALSGCLGDDSGAKPGDDDTTTETTESGGGSDETTEETTEETTAETTESPDMGKIKVGGLVPVSGPYTPLGESLEQGVQVAVNRINGQGGINGREVTAVFEDTQGQPETGKQAVRKLVESEDVDVLVGPISSAVAAVISDFAAEHDVVHFTNNAINPTTMEDCTSTTFRWPIRNRQHANAAAGWALENLGSNVWIHVADYNWGHEFGSGFKEVLKRTGDVNVVGETKSNPGAEDYSTYLSQMAASDADWVLQGLIGGDAIHFISQAADFGLKNELDVFAPANSLRLVRAATGEASIGMYSNSEYYGNLDNAANQAFVEAFQNEFDALPSRFASDGYSALMGWAKAGGEAGSVATGDVLSTLPGLEFESPVGTAYFRECDHQAARPIQITKITEPGEHKWPDLDILETIAPEDGIEPCSEVPCDL